MEMENFIIILLFILRLDISITRGICRRNITTGEFFCCAMFHTVDGKCVECDAGTYRLDKHTHCVRCPDQFYGKRCTEQCTCNECETCDPVNGSCKNVDKCIKSKKGEPITKYLLSYGLPGILFVALIVLIVFIIKWKMTRTIQTEDIQHKNENSIPLECEYGYAVIDESKLIEQPQNLPKSKKTGDNVHICDETMLPGPESPSCGKGSSKEKKDGRMSDDYLQPIFENNRLSAGNEPDMSDSSIKTDLSVNRDTYLHPYNTLSPDWRSRTHVYNDEEPEIKGGGYLNPYQPLQENWLKNTHVYNTAKKTNLSSEKQNDKNVIIEDCRSKQEGEQLSLEMGQN